MRRAVLLRLPPTSVEADPMTDLDRQIIAAANAGRQNLLAHLLKLRAGINRNRGK